ncbi:MAG TPA: acyl-CoA reductase, partial [Magnetospirillum sp.]|nr:acyl-CoA reductase [Magnetospirillum sp.]
PDALTWLAGADPADTRPLPPFSDLAVEFLAALSQALRAAPGARALPDVQTFAFWCRRANLDRLREIQDRRQLRLGRGLLFHVAPANVPVNFAFSFAFGLLAGNANVVRVPSRPSATVDAICAAMGALLAEPRFRDLAASQGIVRFAADSGWSEAFSARSDGRLIWGGDATVAALRTMPTKPRCVDVAFADRTSLCVMGAAAVAAVDADGLERLAADFYNDTYLMDQNACSSPHLVLWLGTPEQAAAAAGRFWPALAQVVAQRYALAPVQAVDKYADLLDAILDGEAIAGVSRFGGGLTVADLSTLPPDLEQRRGRFGLFRQMAADSLSPLAGVLSGRFQTMTYFGADAAQLGRFVTDHRLAGIDRIVPVGRALDMDLVWDGFDLIGQLSRIIDLR